MRALLPICFTMDIPTELLVEHTDEDNATPEFSRGNSSFSASYKKLHNGKVSKYEEKAAEILWRSSGYCPIVKEKIITAQLAVLELQEALQSSRCGKGEVHLIAK